MPTHPMQVVSECGCVGGLWLPGKHSLNIQHKCRQLLHSTDEQVSATARSNRLCPAAVYEQMLLICLMFVMVKTCRIQCSITSYNMTWILLDPPPPTFGYFHCLQKQPCQYAVYWPLDHRCIVIIISRSHTNWLLFLNIFKDCIQLLHNRLCLSQLGASRCCSATTARTAPTDQITWYHDVIFISIPQSTSKHFLCYIVPQMPFFMYLISSVSYLLALSIDSQIPEKVLTFCDEKLSKVNALYLGFIQC